MMDIIEWSKKLGNFDSTEIMNFISLLPAEAWDEFTGRQITSSYHKHTKCIPAVVLDQRSYPNIKLKTFTYLDEISKLCSQIVECFSYFYFGNPPARQFRVTTAMIVMMLPNSTIGLHTDTHPFFGLSHRLHWCLDGDYEKMDFLIADNKIDMKKGDLIEINNRMPHEVIYKGEVPRYNLIIDFMELNSGE